MILVGNKKDLESKRKVPFEQGKQLAEDYGMMFIECSAQTKENVSEVFTKVAGVIHQKVELGEIEIENEVRKSRCILLIKELWSEGKQKGPVDAIKTDDSNSEKIGKK